VPRERLTAILVLLTVTSCTSDSSDTSDSLESEEDIDARIAHLVEMADPRTPEERAEDAEIRERFADAIVVDALAVGAIGWAAVGFTEDHFADLAAHEREHDFTMFSTTASNGGEGAKPVFEVLNVTREWIGERSDDFMVIQSVQDILDAEAQGKTGIMLNFQSADALEDDLANVARFYEAGVRQINFTYNIPNSWAQGTTANSGEDEGLSAMGEDLVRELNRVGIIVDCSHSSDQTCIEAASITTKPMVMSHTNARALMDIDRNSRDEAMRAVAETGGAICVNYLGGFLNDRGDATPPAIAEHVQYVRELVGVEATCAGVDYVQNYGVALRPVIANPEKYPPEQGYGSETQMAPPGDIWGVARVLEEQYGWTEEEIRGYLGENILRVYRANWQ